MSGDAYNVPIRVTLNGEATSADSFEDVEVCIGNVRKSLSEKTLSFDAEKGVFLLPLTQKETFGLHGRERMNLRCKFSGGNVVGLDLGVVNFKAAISREVL